VASRPLLSYGIHTFDDAKPLVSAVAEFARLERPFPLWGKDRMGETSPLGRWRDSSPSGEARHGGSRRKFRASPSPLEGKLSRRDGGGGRPMLVRPRGASNRHSPTSANTRQHRGRPPSRARQRVDRARRGHAEPRRRWIKGAAIVHVLFFSFKDFQGRCRAAPRPWSRRVSRIVAGPPSADAALRRRDGSRRCPTPNFARMAARDRPVGPSSARVAWARQSPDPP
jgi:hypothetical protein